MNRIILVVPERSAGWGSGTINPLLVDVEWQCHASLCAAGVPVDVIGEQALLSGAETKDALVVLASPSPSLRTSVEEHLARGGGRLLIANDRSREGARRAVWRPRTLRGVSARLRLGLRRSPRHARSGLRRLISGARPFTALRPERGEAVLARWGSGGLAALVTGNRGGFTCWRSGFSLDHLDIPAFELLLETLEVAETKGIRSCDPVPGKKRAVVLLLHDVEDPLEGDSRGTRTVIAGIEACLDAERRHGFATTYNLVGKFAETIPESIRQIAKEGHELASHGSTHSVMADLDPDRLRRDVLEAEQSVERICGVRIRGFRSPRSRWSVPLLDCLATRDYLWNAEADVSPFPYPVPRPGAGSLLRIPVALDDWDFVKLGSSPRQVLAAWKAEVRWAIERRCWVGVGSHPSVLGIDPGRMAMYSDFLAWLSAENVAVMTHTGAAAWWRNRKNGSAGTSGERGERCAQTSM
ncbi:MAG TPA: polysaccharide deacetylase family protein [Candidatus Polarisedimenticolia bacterium]|nr:polysaccharide deacetylase family protein [Candidatus Polarisedimenticolia bacterium]